MNATAIVTLAATSLNSCMSVDCTHSNGWKPKASCCAGPVPRTPQEQHSDDQMSESCWRAFRRRRYGCTPRSIAAVCCASRFHAITLLPPRASPTAAALVGRNATTHTSVFLIPLARPTLKMALALVLALVLAPVQPFALALVPGLYHARALPATAMPTAPWWQSRNGRWIA